MIRYYQELSSRLVGYRATIPSDTRCQLQCPQLKLYFHVYSFQSKELVQELEDCRLQISHTLQSCLQSDGRRRYATPPQQISAFNRRSTPEVLDSTIKSYYNPSDLDVVIGDDVIKLNPNGDFNLHFPIRRGDFNLHGGVGGSITAVIADLQEIWEYVLKNHLKIPLR